MKKQEEPKIEARYFTQFGSQSTIVSLDELLNLIKDLEITSLSYIGDDEPKIKARYFTQFGSDVTIVSLDELLNLMERFEVTSLSYVENMFIELMSK